MGLKVAIIGMSPDRQGIPWADPSWEKWGMGWDGEWSRFDRVFDIHDPSIFGDDCYPRGYKERLFNCPKLYLQRALPEYPNSITYPLDDVIETVGVDYFQSSAAYMIALAVHERASDIALFGLSMGDDTPYAYQRANAEYMVGLATGSGISVHIQQPSSICQYKAEQDFVEEYPIRYGWLK